MNNAYGIGVTQNWIWNWHCWL